jgi:electron transfer flavoprotein beta subunit
MARRADKAVRREAGGEEWSTRASASAIADAVQSAAEEGTEYDLLLFGNESADAANYQVGVRVARELGLPCVTGIKTLDVEDGTAVAMREVAGGEEVYEVDLPAVITVKEGINEPRYASMRAKMQARREEVPRQTPTRTEGPGALEMIRLEAPEGDDSEAEILGEGPDAVPEIVRVLDEEVEVL